LLLLKDKAEINAKLYRFITRSIPVAWLWYSSPETREKALAMTTFEDAEKLLSEEVRKDEVTRQYKYVFKYKDKLDEDFDMHPMEPELLPSLLREEADAFYMSPQFQELLPAHQTKLRTDMEANIKAPPLKVDMKAAEGLPSNLLAKGKTLGFTDDSDVWSSVVHLCNFDDGKHILSPMVALCIYRPELVISNPSVKLNFDQFVQKQATKYKVNIRPWLQTNPLHIEWEQIWHGDDLLRGVIQETLRHEVQAWIAAVAIHVMKSEMSLVRHTYEYESRAIMGTIELISELSKKEAFRSVLNFHDIVEAEKADEKMIQDRKQAKQEQHKKGLEIYNASKKIKKG